MNYVFMTDASCDLTQKQVDEVGVRVLPMEFQIEDKCYLHYPDCRMMKLDEFYEIIREGAYPKTSQINFESFKTYFEQYLKAGKDILYTGIPTGLSGTYNTCMIAVEELREKYPKRKIIVIDSGCDSAGLGLPLTSRKPRSMSRTGSSSTTSTSSKEAEEFRASRRPSARRSRSSRSSAATKRAS